MIWFKLYWDEYHEIKEKIWGFTFLDFRICRTKTLEEKWEI